MLIAIATFPLAIKQIKEARKKIPSYSSHFTKGASNLTLAMERYIERLKNDEHPMEKIIYNPSLLVITRDFVKSYGFRRFSRL